MALGDRLVRVFEAFQNNWLDEASAYGAHGEKIAQRILDEENRPSFFNRLVPHLNKPGVFIEMDAIVAAEGTFFCVEIKRYRGIITYLPLEEGGYDKRSIRQKKEINGGFDFAYRQHRNPLLHTKQYVYALKDYKPRLKKIFFHPVVAFMGNDVDISQIHSFEEGMIHISELEEFFKSRRDERFVDRPSQWILDELETLPTWDRITTRTGEVHYGFLKGSSFQATSSEYEKIDIPFTSISEIKISRNGSFSSYDSVDVCLRDGKHRHFDTNDCKVYLDRFGDSDRHKLRNVNHISVGTHAIRKDSGKK